MRRGWGLPALAVAIVLVGWVLVLDAATAVAVGLVVLAAGLVVRRLDLSGEPWRNRPVVVSRPGERRDAAELTWALAGRGGKVGSRALRMVRAVAARRLARHGLSLDDPADEAAVRALVGPRALATLNAHREPWPRLADVEHVVAVLERLGPGGRANPLRSNPR